MEAEGNLIAITTSEITLIATHCYAIDVIMDLTIMSELNITGVPLQGSVTNGTIGNFVSRLLLTPFTVLRILMVYPASTSLNLQYRFFYDISASQPATGTPNGIDLFSEFVGNGVFVGESIAYWVMVNRKFVGQPRSLTLSATNNQAASLVAAAILEIGGEIAFID